MRYLFIALLFLSVNAGAQLKNYVLGSKGDTLNRVDAKNLKQGPWVLHVDEVRGERGYEEEGYFIDDKREGIWKRFSLEGDLMAIETYRFGMKDGKSMYFTNAGEPLREESWRAIDPKNPYDTVDVRDVNDPSKVLKKVIVKVEPISYKNGTWSFYDPMSGTVVKTEDWVMNQPKVKAAAADDDMAPIDVADGTATTVKKDEKKAKPKEVLEYEKKNSGKKKIKVRDGNTGG
jgi:antitoxin component YwqK of YwqJK toxin-antitoxin module